MMKNQKRDLICLNEYGSTQPVISVKPAIIN